MVAVLVFMVAYFLAMGAATALADAALRRHRPGGLRRPGPRPRPWTVAEERQLMAEIEEWLAQQPR